MPLVARPALAAHARSSRLTNTYQTFDPRLPAPCASSLPPSARAWWPPWPALTMAATCSSYQSCKARSSRERGRDGSTPSCLSVGGSGARTGSAARACAGHATCSHLVCWPPLRGRGMHLTLVLSTRCCVLAATAVRRLLCAAGSPVWVTSRTGGRPPRAHLAVKQRASGGFG